MTYTSYICGIHVFMNINVQVQINIFPSVKEIHKNESNTNGVHVKKEHWWFSLGDGIIDYFIFLYDFLYFPSIL